MAEKFAKPQIVPIRTERRRARRAERTVLLVHSRRKAKLERWLCGDALSTRRALHLAKSTSKGRPGLILRLCEFWIVPAGYGAVFLFLCVSLCTSPGWYDVGGMLCAGNCGCDAFPVRSFANGSSTRTT